MAEGLSTKNAKRLVAELRVRKVTPREEESAVLDRAVEVIGDKTEAMRWMGVPVRALNYATPVSLLHTPKGRKAVIAVLARLEHGVL